MGRTRLTTLAPVLATVVTVVTVVTSCSSPAGDDAVARAAPAATSDTTSTPTTPNPAAATSAIGTTTTTTTTTSSPTAATTAASTAATTTTTSTATTTTTSTATTTTTSTTTSTTSTTVPEPPMTACASVAHIGDSTSAYLWEARYIGGNPANAMEARYREVGVARVVADNSGGRSVVERIADWQTNALEVATSIRRSGFEGCWVIMIGTNDAANVAAGARTGHADRILRMLYAIGDQPVLWVDTVTRRGTTAYRNDSMRAFNEVLYRIADERDDVAVLRWSEAVRPEWFQSDGLHYTPDGRVWRAAITALALAESFPR